MRSDSIGFFWQDKQRERRGGPIDRPMPPIPETGWKVPQEFPDLRLAPALAIDVETKDPELDDHGPGWARGVGHIVGIAVGTSDYYRWYFPIRHEVDTDDNLPPEHVIAWAKDQLSGPQPKIGANITYDVGWLRQEGIHVGGPLFDVEFAEALLSEAATVNLDDLGERYLGIGKTGDILYQWCADFYGGQPNHRQRKNIYRAPPCLVGPYAEGDVTLPFGVLEKQWVRLAQQNLMHIFDMENRLIRLMVEMRFAGVTLDLRRAEGLRLVLDEAVKELDEQITELVGFEVNVDSNEQMGNAFEACGLSYGYTPKGKPSFRKEFLQSVDHPLAKLVLERRQRAKLKGTFVEGYMLKSHINGKLYGSFNQLRGDESGARSGRYSSSNPNLQNIPIRSDLGKEIRKGFIPDIGHDCWRKIDYSQIEYRMLAHYAVGPGAHDLRRRYNADPKVDFHVMVQGIIRDIVNMDLDRPLVKNINFGTVYGMGEPKLATYLGLAPQAAKSLFAAIHKAAPFLKATMDATMKEADQFGYITTVLGRRSRFDLWVPDRYDEAAIPLPYEKAVLAYRNPRRAYLHKALNRRLQGSAADLLKMAMLKCWEDGIFDTIGVPRLTVHDELDFSDPGGKEEGFREMIHIMESALPISVPVRADHSVGASWGEVKDEPLVG